MSNVDHEHIYDIFASLYTEYLIPGYKIYLNRSTIEMTVTLGDLLQRLKSKSTAIYIDIDDIPNILWFDVKEKTISRYCNIKTDLSDFDVILNAIFEKWLPEYLYFEGQIRNDPVQYICFYMLNRIDGLDHEETLDILDFYDTDDILHMDDVIHTMVKEYN